MWLYKRRPNPWLALGACLTVMALINFLLTPLWLNIMYGKAFVIFSGAKIIKNIVKLPIDVALLYGALRMAQRAGQRPAGRKRTKAHVPTGRRAFCFSSAFI